VKAGPGEAGGAVKEGADLAPAPPVDVDAAKKKATIPAPPPAVPPAPTPNLPSPTIPPAPTSTVKPTAAQPSAASIRRLVENLPPLPDELDH
jgi:hypothetical protein